MLNTLRRLPRFVVLTKSRSPKLTFPARIITRQNSDVFSSKWKTEIDKGTKELDEEKTKLEDLPPHKIVSDLSEEEVEKITQGFAGRKLKLIDVGRSFWWLENNNFPVPDSLTEAQYEQILKYESKRAQTLYIHAIVNGKDQDEETLEKIQKEDQIFFSPLRVDPPEALERVIGDDEKLQAKWKQCQYEHERMQMNSPIGLWSILSENDLRDILTLQSESAIGKTLIFYDIRASSLFRGWVKKVGRLAHGERVQEEMRKKFEEEKHIVYSLGHNNIMLRQYDTDMDKYSNWRVFRDSISEWGQPLVIDVSWYDTMEFKMAKSFVYREMPYSNSFNRAKQHPFHIHYTGVTSEKMKKELNRFNPKLLKDEMPETYTEKSYLDIFPKEKLVYLSPDSRNELVYDEDDVYVIGGLVDLKPCPNGSLGKAKKEGIRHAHLPLKRVIGMNCILNIEAVVAILADYRETRDWMYAFRWVPPRIFARRMKSGPFTRREESVYLAHKSLYPHAYLMNNWCLNPKQYREKYIEELKKVPANDRTLIDPSKYAAKNKSSTGAMGINAKLERLTDMAIR